MHAIFPPSTLETKMYWHKMGGMREVCDTRVRVRWRQCCPMSAYIPRATASGIIVVLFIVTIDSADGSEDESNRNIGFSVDLEMVIMESDDEDPPWVAGTACFPPLDDFGALEDTSSLSS